MNNTINEILKEFETNFIGTDKDGNERVWAGKDSPFYYKHWLKGSLNRIQNETAKQILEDIYNESEPSEDINDGTLALVLEKGNYEKLKSKYGIQETEKVE